MKVFEKIGFFVLSAAVCCLVLLVAAGCKKDKSYGECNPATQEGCSAGQVCAASGPDEGMCLDSCDPAAADPCGDGEVCFRYGGGLYGCTPTCGGNGDCSNGWICAPVAGGESVCRPECTLGSDTCAEGEVCQVLPDGTAVCTAQCDPLQPTDCGDEMACELRTDDMYACYEPVYLAGRVFDSTNNDPIPDAHVIAADKTGASASDVAITDAEGMYELQVPVERNPDGTLYEGVFTLRVSAADYLPYPHGIRPAIPVDAAQAAQVEGEGRWLLQNASTDVALIPLPADQQGQGSISGGVVASSGNATPSGVLVVIEGGTPPSPFGFTDKSGVYTIFNVPAGSWTVHGYKAFLQLDTVPVTLTAGQDLTGIDLVENDKPYGTISGSLNIVNAEGGSMTTVVLVPVSTYSDTFVKGEVPPGLREPPPPEEPNVTGAYSIEGIPDGTYKVLAAFENDRLVRDPDPSIAGTQIVEMTVPDGTSYELTIQDAFKVTQALVIISPGATEPELVTGNPTFIWMDDSSEVKYSIVVYNAYGDEVWRDDELPRVTGSETVEVPYAGDPLEDGMYYQFRAMSWRDTGPISQTEDLLGVFYTPGSAI